MTRWLTDPVPAVCSHAAESKESMVVNLVAAAGAQVITSRDRHLLSERDATTSVGEEFMSWFDFFEMLTPI